MAGTIVTDRIESDASYASSVNIASPLVIANTLTMGSAAAISGNVNIDSATLFVDGVNNRVGMGTQNPVAPLDVVYGGNTAYHFSAHSDLYTSASFGVRYAGDGFSSVLFNYGNRGAGNFWKIDAASGFFGIAKVTNGSTTLTNAIDIDSSGRVKKPYQPAFRVRKSASQTIQNNSADIKVTYDTADTNIGSHYNTSTSRFTAPVAGWYHFNAFFMFESFPTDWSYSFIRFVLNGSSSNSEIMYGRIPSGSNYLTMAASTYYYLSVNDYFEVFTRIVGGSSNAQIRASFAEFSGMLVC
jgi:hypothetical protein